MNPVKNPPPPDIGPNSSERDVTNLQDALLFLAESRRLQLAEEERAALQNDRLEQRWDEGTAYSVIAFRDQQGLEAAEVVDKRMAEVLNRILKELGAFESPAQDAPHVVSGQVRREDGQLFQRGLVRAFHQREGGAIRLGEDMTDRDGRYTISYLVPEALGGVNLVVEVYGDEGLRLQSSQVIRDAGSPEIVDLVAPVVTLGVGPRTLEGRVIFDNRLPTDRLVLRLYRLDVGGEETKVGETITDSLGVYTFGPLEVGDRAAGLQIRTVDDEALEKPLSRTLYDLADDAHIIVNLVVPTAFKPPAAEYQRLQSALRQHLGELAELSSVREDPGQRDLTILHRATGWDARLIALATIADRLSADEEIGLPSEALYGMLRAGLPNDKESLARRTVGEVERALEMAQNAGIISLDDKQTAKAIADFENFARASFHLAIAPGGLSNFGELLEKSGLDESDRRRFEDVCFDHRGSADELWKAVLDAGLSEKQVDGLRLQGKLAFLTLDNSALTADLQQEIESTSNLGQLAEIDLYREDTWKKRLTRLAESSRLPLEKLIPPGYQADEVQERLDAYAADLARQVRQSFPTRVARQRIINDEWSLGQNHASVKRAVTTFLRQSEPLGFELGGTPLDDFIARNSESVLKDIPPEEREPMAKSLRRLARLYQITPNDESLRVVSKTNIHSAYDLAEFSEDEFLDEYGGLFASEDEAKLVIRKAQQVTAVAYNVIAAAKQLDSAPTVYALSGSSTEREGARKNLLKRYPSMESLFGSLDYCECEHCRSVLSPAAYLVDLLEFLNPDAARWTSFLEKWKSEHNNEAYDGPRYGYRKPFDALMERRPDLAHLPLTCENTHTVLPHIDVVNEVLEYFVVHEKLEAGAAHDTAGATSSELLAEPQHLLGEAYKTLNDSRYPFILPFDLWLERVRCFLLHLRTPLWSVLEVFRTSDKLFYEFPTRSLYHRVEIFTEYLGLSPSEHALYLGNPIATWHGRYGYANTAEALCDVGRLSEGGRAACLHLSSSGTPLHIEPGLPNARILARRLGVSYKELAELVESAFVNPALHDLKIPWKLRPDLHVVVSYLNNRTRPEFAAEKAAFEERLAALDSEYRQQPGFALSKIDALALSPAFKSCLLLRDREPSGKCNFDQIWLEFADGTPATAFVLLKLNLFVRLWKTLGWTIEETARALEVFIPKNSLPLSDDSIGPALQTAIIYLSHLKELHARLTAGTESRIKLLTFWADMFSTGKHSLYEQLFLTQSLKKSYPIFDDILGQFLSTPGILLRDHFPAIQSACSVTSEEIGRILATEKGKAFAEAHAILEEEPLNLATVSAIFRYGFLARMLRLSVRDLIALKELSGGTPFASLHPNRLAKIEEDHPFTKTLAFLDLISAVEESGLTIEDLEFLFRHVFDERGTYRPDRDATVALLRTLAAGIYAIRTEHAVSTDSSAVSDELLRRELGLGLAPAVIEQFLAMVNGTAEFGVSKTGVAPAAQLSPDDFIDEPAVIEVRYNETLREQTLIVRLFDPHRKGLEERHPSELFVDLMKIAGQQAKSFFVTQLKKQTLRVPNDTGFLEEDDFTNLFDPLTPPVRINPEDTPEVIGAKVKENERIDRENQDALRRRRFRIAEAFLPYLQRRLIRQFIVGTLTAHTGGNAVLVESLIVDERLLTLGARDASEMAKPLLEEFADIGERGVTVSFFDAAGKPLGESVVLIDADTGLFALNAVPADSKEVRLIAYFEVPAPETYRFHILLEPQGIEAQLHLGDLGGVPNPLMSGTAGQDGTELGGRTDQYVELKLGVLYRVELRVKEFQLGRVRLLIQGETLPKGSFARLALYPAAAIERAERALMLLEKALLLAEKLTLTEREIRYLVTHAKDFDNFDLSKLPTSPTEISREDVNALFKQFLRAAAYARLKRSIAGGTEDIIGIFEAHTTKDAYGLIAKLTRRDVATVEAAAKALFATPPFKSEKPLERLWQALELVDRLGVGVPLITDWTRIVSAGASADKRFAIARDVRQAIKARFDMETWPRVARGIFDGLRQRQRDALVAYISHRQGFERIEELFEYFLIDPGMEPVVETSRIRLAISAVQTFVQRCLLNLEPKVHPSAINAQHWQWMKAYRVWEANRKIFLFPENWLEPEFRDDTTHLFRDLQGALLQDDVSNESSEKAFLRYLRGLEELAQLEMVTMYLEEKPLGSDVIHLIGRTFGIPQKYFYRRYSNQAWTPWEPVGAEIASDHIVAVVWRARLYLFWLDFLIKAKDPSGETVILNINDLRIKTAVSMEVQIQLKWTSYFQGEWSSPQASGFANPIRHGIPNSFRPSNVTVSVSKDYEEGEERAVNINLWGILSASFRVVSVNSTPLPSPSTKSLITPYSVSDFSATTLLSSEALEVNFTGQITTVTTKVTGSGTTSTTEYFAPPREILGRGYKFSLLPFANQPPATSEEEQAFQGLLHPPENNTQVRAAAEPKFLRRPFFYQDHSHTFFVEPTLTEARFEKWEHFGGAGAGSSGGSGGGAGGSPGGAGSGGYRILQDRI